MKRPIVLTILDGYGLRDETHGNAVKLAQNPTFEMLWNEYPHTKLVASGQLVGLPKGQMGNSEVGHMNIGAGRIVYQPLEMINKAIADEEFYQNETIQSVMNHVKKNQSKLHLMGLISDGGVHSHIHHLLSLLEMCKRENVERVYLHLFTDGRDVPPKSAYTYISQVEETLEKLGIGTIASISGRYYAMDRDNNFDRLKKAYDVIVHNAGDIEPSLKTYIEESYAKGITDEFFLPVRFTEDGNVEENDGIIAFNFRKDRLRELFTAITNPDAVEMDCVHFQNVKTITMMPVVQSVHAPHAFNDPVLTNILGEYIEKQGLAQLRIAETEKYAHVTFFFNGGVEAPNANEVRVLVPSPKVATYDLKPEMSAYEVTDKVLEQLSTGEYDVMILNYANCDMVGHTGVLEAAEKAVATVDECVDRVLKKILEMGGGALLTADHGNADKMIAEDGSPFTAHTTNPVPVVLVNDSLKGAALRDGGVLADLAPTLLDMMGIAVPVEMTGKSLIVR